MPHEVDVELHNLVKRHGGQHAYAFDPTLGATRSQTQASWYVLPPGGAGSPWLVKIPGAAPLLSGALRRTTSRNLVKRHGTDRGRADPFER